MASCKKLWWSPLKLVEVGNTFGQAMEEPVTVWLVRLWDMESYGISLTAVDTKYEQ